MFFGKCELPLSEEKQMILPPNYRGAQRNVAYLTQGFERNLFLLTQDAFGKIYSHVKELSISDPLARLFMRLFLGSAIEIEINSSGQIEIPLNLCEYAEIDKEVVIVGQGEYSEIWSPSLWEKQAEHLCDYDANVHRFEKFHISLA